MFTIEQVNEAHSKVKSGADFPIYIKDLIALGVIQYDTYVSDGHSVYLGVQNYKVVSPSKYTWLLINELADIPQFEHSLKIHQDGLTDYMQFCKDSAEAGVMKWCVNLQAMTCTYYDKNEGIMLTEKIQAVCE